MTRQEIKDIVLQMLGEIAPEADLPSLNPEVSFRDQLDLDSMDLLNFVIALHKRFGVEIPEKDYPKLLTLSGGINYLAAALRVPQST